MLKFSKRYYNKENLIILTNILWKKKYYKSLSNEKLNNQIRISRNLNESSFILKRKEKLF